jgi:hypothetical protein
MKMNPRSVFSKLFSMEEGLKILSYQEETSPIKMSTGLEGIVNGEPLCCHW